MFHQLLSREYNTDAADSIHYQRALPAGNDRAYTKISSAFKTARFEYHRAQ